MNKKQKISLFISSLIMNITAIFITFLVFQATVYIIARGMHIPIGINSYKIIFKLSNNSPLWTNASITAIYGLPPFVSLGLAIACRKIYEKYARKKRGNLKLFLSWGSLHFENMFLGSIIVGLLTQSGFSYFMNWMYIPFVVQIAIAIGAIIFLYFRHFFLNYSFSQTAPESNIINKDTHKKYKLFIIYLPFGAGIILLSLISFPDFSIQELMMKTLPALALIKTRKYIDYEDVKLVRNSTTFSPNYALIIPIVLFIVTFIFVL